MSLPLRGWLGPAVLAVLIGFCSFVPPADAATCQAGHITCTRWCAKYRPNPKDNCMTGASRSCDRIGPDRCVPDQAPRMISCKAWCYKYRSGSKSCLQTDARSCIRLYGNLEHMVRDRPPD